MINGHILKNSLNCLSSTLMLPPSYVTHPTQQLHVKTPGLMLNDKKITNGEQEWRTSPFME